MKSGKVIFVLILVVVTLGLIFSLFITVKSEILDETGPKAYSFFIAGHTYGYTWVDNKGFHPPFREKFELINDRKSEMGFLLGDVVFECTEEDWEEVDSVLQYLNCTTYIAVGNHDMVDRELYETRYGKTYYSFLHRGDLFIVLDPNIDQWNISGKQLTFLKETLTRDEKESRNIFVFFHQILWWANDNKYSKVGVNSLKGRAPAINFWTEIEPMFHSLSKPVYMFGGDVGAVNWSVDFMYDTYDNITFAATGMGNGDTDNFVFVNVDTSGKVSFDLINLVGDDIHALGNLEDYVLPLK